MSATPTKTELIDLFWRSIWTFIAGLGGAQIAGALFGFDIAMVHQLELSLVAAFITTLKAYASNKLGTGTATSRDEPPIGLQPVASNSATPAQ